MCHTPRRLLYPLILILILTMNRSPAAEPQARQDGGSKHVRVLAVGNSFTRNANRYLQDLVDATEHRLTYQALIIGGSSLELHAGKALAFEKNPNDPSSKYSGNTSLQDALRASDWDFVTLQQVSMKSHDRSTYQPYLSQLADLVSRYSPGAQLLVHQTWAYRRDDERFDGPSADKNEPSTQEEMYRGLSDAYQAVAAEIGAKRIPVGDAFFLADSDPNFGYRVDDRFDVTTATHPGLPDQTHSLHVGWRWQTKDGTPVMQMDGHHANLAGEYLGACVWLETLFGESPVGNAFVPEGLDSDYARFLQLTAHQAVQTAGDAPKTSADHSPAFEDANPRRYELAARASELDQRTRSYPQIDFVAESNGKPQDIQHASVDTRVTPRGKLVIWLMGYNAGLFERLNQYGIHAIQVRYANRWFGTLCRPQPSDAFARGRVRLEAATGEDISDELDLAKPDGAAERAFQFVKWLAKENPEGRWDQFLTADGKRLRFDKVILSGSSHGSTTAARWAKHQRVDRVVMLCGPRDQDQDWQALPSATPANRFFGFSHVLDGGWTGDHYCRSWDLLGMHQFGPIVNVDSAQPPYDNTRRLISSADVGGDAKRAHSSVTPGKSSPQAEDGGLQYEPVWNYLYTHPVQEVGEATPIDEGCLKEHVSY